MRSHLAGGEDGVGVAVGGSVDADEHVVRGGEGREGHGAEGVRGVEGIEELGFHGVREGGGWCHVCCCWNAEGVVVCFTMCVGME